MADWEFLDYSSFHTLYASVPAGLFEGERWFADRGLRSELELVDGIQFQRDSSGPVITLNLFKTQPFAGYYYYIPFLITKGPGIYSDVWFERNGYYFYNAVSTPEYISLIEELVENRSSCYTSQGRYRFQSFRNFKDLHLRQQGGTSNSLLFVNRNYLLKNYRRIYPGVNPELNISASLTELGSEQIPAIYGFFSYQAQDEYTLGILMEQVENSGTGWERWGRILKAASPEQEAELEREAGILGNALAMLHCDLATVAKQDRAYSELRYIDLEERAERLGAEIRTSLAGLMEMESILAKLASIKKSLSGRNLGAKFRIHGDLHLEQIIKTDDGWKILDFEGEPLKPIPERENCDSPLKDLASMLRSISYRLNGRDTNRREIESKICSSLIDGYLRSCREMNADFLPDNKEFKSLLTFFQMERAVYECLYESKYRPDWLWIPQAGLAELVRN